MSRRTHHIIGAIGFTVYVMAGIVGGIALYDPALVPDPVGATFGFLGMFSIFPTCHLLVP